MERESTSGDLPLDSTRIHNDAQEDHDVPGVEAVYDTLELTDLQESSSHALDNTAADDHDVASFLRSAGVEVSEDHHDVDMGLNMDEDMGLQTAMEDHHPPVEGMTHLDMHAFHPDSDHELLHHGGEEPTFDLHQIHQELDASASLPQDNHDAMIEHAQHEFGDTHVYHNEIDSTSHDPHARSFADLNMAPSPDAHMPLVGRHAEEAPIPTGVQIVNEEVLINEEGMVPLSEEVPSMLTFKEEHEGEHDKGLHYQEVSVILCCYHAERCRLIRMALHLDSYSRKLPTFCSVACIKFRCSSHGQDTVRKQSSFADRSRSYRANHCILQASVSRGSSSANFGSAWRISAERGVLVLHADAGCDHRQKGESVKESRSEAAGTADFCRSGGRFRGNGK